MSSKRISEIPVPYEEIEGQRRNSHIYVANGYGYRIRNAHGQISYMCCVNKRCTGTSTLDVVQKLLIPKREHNHPPNPQEFVKVKLIASLKRKAEHTDLRLGEFFQKELEKANVKNPHDLGLDFKKVGNVFYKRKKLKKPFLLSQVKDTCSANLRDDSALERTGVVPPFNSEEDADNLNRETSLGVHSMEIGAEGSIGDDSCSRDEHDSSQQEIYSTIDASDINSHSPHQLPFSVPAMKASPGPKQSLQTKLASSSHVSEELPTTSSLDMQQPTTSLSYMPPPTTSSSYIQPPTTSSSNMPPPTTSSSFIQPPTTSSSYMPPPTTSSSDSTGSESYQLRHNNHLSLVLNQLAEDEAFMDVMLTAEGRQVKAHKSVLSAVSPYFSGVLRSNPCQHPVIIMPNDVRYDDLARIISFIYRGEVCVPAKELMSLMKVADQLLITGLSQKGNRDILSYLNGSSTEGSPSPPSVPHSLARGTPGTHSEADAVCSSQRQESTEQSNTKKRAKAADRIGSHSSGSQATPSSTETREPPSLQSGQDSDDDSDGFTSDFLDPTPVGSPSNDTPVVDVDISLIKETFEVLVGFQTCLQLQDTPYAKVQVIEI